jgi:hypothetical protein
MPSLTSQTEAMLALDIWQHRHLHFVFFLCLRVSTIDICCSYSHICNPNPSLCPTVVSSLLSRRLGWVWNASSKTNKQNIRGSLLHVEIWWSLSLHRMSCNWQLLQWRINIRAVTGRKTEILIIIQLWITRLVQIEKRYVERLNAEIIWLLENVLYWKIVDYRLGNMKWN